MKQFFFLRLLLLMFFCQMVTGCQYSCSEGKDSVSFACWNVQTFFDANLDGCEYSEFQKSKYWNKNAYEERLNRLVEVIKELDCDVFVLEEIENDAVVMDIRNFLAGSFWEFGKNWNYSCFAKNDGAAIGCAVFSRFPLSDVKVHSLELQNENLLQCEIRPVLQVTVGVGSKKLFVFANHWKSKSGDSVLGENLRKMQEALLVDRVCKLEKETDTIPCVIICGDFNEDITEFQKNENIGSDAGNIILKSVQGNQKGIFCNEELVVFSPWISSDGGFSTGIGSYYYRNNWERIDQIFSCGAASISDFEPVAKEPWATEKNIPLSYKIYTGEGYSDHLPLRCRVCF